MNFVTLSLFIFFCAPDFTLCILWDVPGMMPEVLCGPLVAQVYWLVSKCDAQTLLELGALEEQCRAAGSLLHVNVVTGSRLQVQAIL